MHLYIEEWSHALTCRAQKTRLPERSPKEVVSEGARVGRKRRIREHQLLSSCSLVTDLLVKNFLSPHRDGIEVRVKVNMGCVQRVNLRFGLSGWTDHGGKVDSRLTRRGIGPLLRAHFGPTDHTRSAFLSARQHTVCRNIVSTSLSYDSLLSLKSKSWDRASNLSPSLSSSGGVASNQARGNERQAFAAVDKPTSLICGSDLAKLRSLKTIGWSRA